MDKTSGVLTTVKLQAMLDMGLNPQVRSRLELQQALTESGEKISRHGVEAWFRRRDSNLPIPRPSLSDDALSFAIPKRRWGPILGVFGLHRPDLDCNDDGFQHFCYQRAGEVVPVAAAPATFDKAALTLIGREYAADSLTGAYQQASQGSPSLVLIEGAPGVGKSEQLNLLRRALSTAGALTLNAACTEGSDTPLLPVMSLFQLSLDKLAQHDSGLAPRFQSLNRRWTAGEAGDEPAMRRVLELANALVKISRTTPVAVIVDDVHWADRFSCEFIEHLIRQSSAQATAQMLFVCGHRRGTDTDRSPFPYETFFESGTVISIEPLERKDTERLLAELAGAKPSRELLDVVWQHSHGNPLHVLQLVNYLTENTLLHTASGQADVAQDVDSANLPHSVSDLYLNRVKRAPRDTRALLHVAAALAREFTIDDMQALLPNRSLRRIITALENAESADLISTDGDRFRFRHPYVRTTLYGSLGSARRARMHLNIANRLYRPALADDELHTLELARHLWFAKSLVNKTVLCEACYAAVNLARRIGAWDKVVQFARVIRETGHKGLSDGQKTRVNQALATGLHQHGSKEAAIKLLDSIIADTESTDLLAYAAALNEKVRIVRNFRPYEPDKQEVAALEDALAAVAQRDEALACDICVTLAFHHQLSKQPERAIQIAKRAEQVLGDQPLHNYRAKAHVASGLALMNTMRIRDALGQFRRAKIHADRAGDKATAARALQRMLTPQFMLGRVDDAELTLEELRADAAFELNTGEDSLAIACDLAIATVKSDDERVEGLFEQGVRVMRESGYAWAAMQIVSTYASWHCRHLRFGEARRAVDLLEHDATLRNTQTGGYMIPLMRTHLQKGDHDIDAVFTNIQDRTERSNSANLAVINSVCLLARTSLNKGRVEQVEALMPGLEAAYHEGIAFTNIWPTCVPETVAECLRFLGREDEVVFYERSAKKLVEQQALRVIPSASA